MLGGIYDKSILRPIPFENTPMDLIETLIPANPFGLFTTQIDHTNNSFNNAPREYQPMCDRW